MVATTGQLAQMHVQMRKPYIEYDRRMAEKNIKYMLTSVARNIKEQFALYAQGRESLSHVNVYRKLAGLQPISEPDNKKIVTWTLNSYHCIDLEDGNPDNDYARAFDIAILKAARTPTWDLKADLDGDGVPEYAEAAQIAKDVGFNAGYFWKKKDAPHSQWEIVKNLTMV